MSSRLYWIVPIFWLAISPQAAVLPGRPFEVYERAGQRIASAAFFKPAETSSSDLAFTMAPLILQAAHIPKSQVSTTPSAIALTNTFGTLVFSNRTLAIAYAQPAIYYETDSIEIKGRPHARLTYLWCHHLSRDRPASLPMQGVRMTLDSQGKAALWEVLADSSGLGLIFAARSVEEAARAEFGPPLPGRKFALERSVTEARDTVVARVIEDGPVPMGPIIYLSENTNSVLTLICRCMPAQADDVLETRIYNLIPAPMAPKESLLMQARHTTGLRPAFWPGSKASQARLEKTLRLPTSF